MRWTDWLGQQATDATPLAARSRSDVEARLRDAIRGGLATPRFRVLSSGHSTSDVARPVPGQYLFVLDALSWNPERADEPWFLPTPRPGGPAVVWIPAALKVRDANAMLAARGLAFANLGSYDQQTIFGAMTTGTHGSGMISGPLADFLVAIDVTCVIPNAKGKPEIVSYRVESTWGTTTNVPGFEKATRMRVLRDDRAFNALGVSMGCFGVVTGVVVKVMPAYWLRETRRILGWRELRDGIRSGICPDVSRHDRADLCLTSLPVRRLDDHAVLVRERTVLPNRPGVTSPPVRDDKRTRAARKQWEDHGRDRIAAALALNDGAVTASNNPIIANAVVFSNLSDEAEEPPFESRSDRVLFSSVGDYLAATSTEVAIPRERWMDAADAVVRTLQDLHNSEAGLHTLSPVGIRFSQASRFFLAPQGGRETCTFEFPTPIGTTRDHGHKDTEVDVPLVLSKLETVLVEGFDGRPHWGQRWWTRLDRLESAYGDRMVRWREQRARFDPYGIFRNGFSDRMRF